jgi:hypothetical protein
VRMLRHGQGPILEAAASARTLDGLITCRDRIEARHLRITRRCITRLRITRLRITTVNGDFAECIFATELTRRSSSPDNYRVITGVGRTGASKSVSPGLRAAFGKFPLVRS